MIKKIGVILLLVMMAQLLSGCQLARLFQFKNQLRYFDANISFDTANSMVFLNPLLTGDDILLLSGTPPNTDVTENATQTTWTYLIKKIPDSTAMAAPPLYLKLKLHFQNNRLVRAVYDPALARLISHKTLRQGLMALGNGDYHDRSRSLSPGQSKSGQKWDLSDLPNQSRFQETLGRPTVEKRFATDSSWVYTFEEIGPNNTVLRHPEIRAFFNNESLALDMISTSLLGPRIIFRFND